MAKPVTNPRIAKLIELEVAGRIKPEHQQELDAYRARGLAPKSNNGDESERTAAFLATRVAGGIDDLNRVPAGSERPTVGAEVAGWFGSSARNYANSEDRQRVEAAQKDILDAALTLGTGAAYSPEQLEGYRTSYFPQLGDEPATVADKERRLNRLLESARIKAGDAGDAIDKALKASVSETETFPAGAAGATVSTDGSSTFSTEDDKRYAADINRLLADPKSTRADFDRLAVQYGARDAFGPDLDRALATRTRGGKVAVATPTSGVTGPTVLGTLAATPAGAAATGVANALTAGTLDEIVGATGGDQDAANLAKRVMAADHPYAYGGGEIAGTVAASLAGGAGLARIAPSLAPGAASLIGDTAYGAAYGAGENNADRLTGAGKGALLAGGGNLAGQAALRGAAGLIAPKVSADAALLRDGGVRLTLGQAIGPTASRVEEKLTSLPIVGDLIRNGRRRALSDFNNGYLNDSLSRIGAKLPDGAAGTEAMRFGQKAFDDAYDVARSGMQLVPDAQMATDLTDLSTRVAGGQLDDAAADRLGKIYESEVLRRIRAPLIDGDTYKTISSNLGKLQRSTRQANPELSEAIGEMQSVIDGAARRSSPPDAVAAMDAADEGYALWVRAEKAAARRGGDTATFTPKGLDAEVQRADGSVRSRAFLRGDALGQDWATAGKSLIGDEVPNSGTIDRGLMNLSAIGGISAVGALKPATAIPVGALAALYAPGVRDVVSAIAAGSRGAGAEAVGGVLRNVAPLAGTFGTGGALSAFGRR